MEDDYRVGIPSSWGDEEIKKFCLRFANQDFKFKELQDGK